MTDPADLARLAALTRLKPSGRVTVGLGIAGVVLGVVTAMAEGGNATALAGNLLVNPFTLTGVVLIALGFQRKTPALVRCTSCGEPNLPGEKTCRSCGMS
jgi:hypothetical protein